MAQKTRIQKPHDLSNSYISLSDSEALKALTELGAFQFHSFAHENLIQERRMHFE